MEMLYDQIQESVSFLHSQTQVKPRIGIILGTGLSNLADEIMADCAIPFAQIPHFPISTVKGHKGKLIIGYLESIPVIAMAGRFHYYEGYTMQQVTFPVRVMKFMGIEQIFISNAAGSVNQHIYAGDLVFIKDHINLHAENPLRGSNDDRLGLRFPDMMNAYDRKLNAQALSIAHTHGIRAHEGVYLGLQGPNLETPAEYRFAHTIGADMVGMSTIPEVIVARHMDLPAWVVSIATNRCYPLEDLTPTTHEEVIAVAQAAEKKLTIIVKELLRNMA